MSTKLFKNTEGKVLMSVGNKLIKQPYEFGLAFQNRMGLSNYFEASGLNIQKGWSFLVLGIIKTNNDCGLFSIISSSLGLSDNIMIRQTSLFPNIIDNYLLLKTIINFTINNPIYICISDNSQFFNGNGISTISNIVNPVSRDKLRIGYSGDINNNNISFSSAFSATSLLNRLYIFNRSLTVEELQYFKNNLLYNDLQSTEGLMHDYDLSKVSVKNINGVDYACATDSVGGKHAILQNLPAGTAQQKVDFANANLFVPFQ